MIFFTLDLNTPEERARFQIDENTHTASWDFYCKCYSYTIRKIIATGLSEDYALNCRAKPLLFLIRHYIELCIKRNLNHNNIGFATTHDLISLLELMPNQGYVPNGFTSIATELNYDGKGECFRYDKDHNGHNFFNGCHTINLANILQDYIELQSNSGFLIDSLCEEFPNNNITNCDLTFHLHEASTIGQIRTQYDHVIEYIVKGVESEEYDLNKVYLPLFFLIRHSIEIALKNNIYDASELTNVRSEKELKKPHSIESLFNHFAGETGYVKKTNKDLSPDTQVTIQNYLKEYNKLKNMIHKLDTNSYFLRFPFDNNNNPHKLSINKNTLLVLEVIRLYMVTDAFITFTNDVLREDGVLQETEMY